VDSLPDKESILVVDDAPDTLEVIKRNLDAHGYRVYIALSVGEAMKILEENSIDLVVTDFKMPDVSGLDLVRYVRENLKSTEVMMITGYATISGAVDAIKIGADEYLAKPFTDDELLTAVERCLSKLHMRLLGQTQKDNKVANQYGLIGESKAIQKVFKAIKKASSTSATVLITGESGTGKELIARAIHYNSPRASAPFVPINCGGIPEGLLESELFGYIKGAFTGATETRAGFFQSAEGGSIFLDEISETSFSMQVKLLRVLQDKEICMIGSNRTQKVNVRILAATNKDLLKLIDKGAFREDLFYRLNVITLAIPPLREREQDIIILATYFVSKFSREFGKKTPQFSDKTLNALKQYYWPGNVRELENMMQQIVVMNDGDLIDVPDLPAHMRFTTPKKSNLRKTLQDVELEYINNVLASVNGNKTRASEILKIDRKTLREKLKSKQ